MNRFAQTSFACTLAVPDIFSGVGTRPRLCRPLRQPFLPSSATGGGRKRCSGNPSAVGSRHSQHKKKLGTPKGVPSFFGKLHRFRYRLITQKLFFNHFSCRFKKSFSPHFATIAVRVSTVFCHMRFTIIFGQIFYAVEYQFHIF